MLTSILSYLFFAYFRNILQCTFHLFSWDTDLVRLCLGVLTDGCDLLGPFFGTGMLGIGISYGAIRGEAAALVDFIISSSVLMKVSQVDDKRLAASSSV